MSPTCCSRLYGQRDDTAAVIEYMWLSLESLNIHKSLVPSSQNPFPRRLTEVKLFPLRMFFFLRFPRLHGPVECPSLLHSKDR
eukprot:5576176-Amphidinium_carterae.2